jgi:hypothetical protein
MPHPLDKKIIFHYRLNSGNIKNVMKEVVDYYNDIKFKLFLPLKTSYHIILYPFTLFIFYIEVCIYSSLIITIYIITIR